MRADAGSFGEFPAAASTGVGATVLECSPPPTPVRRCDGDHKRVAGSAAGGGPEADEEEAPVGSTGGAAGGGGRTP